MTTHSPSLRQFLILLCLAWPCGSPSTAIGQELTEFPERDLQKSPHRILNEGLTRRDIPKIGRWVQSLQEQSFSPEQLFGRIAEIRQNHPQMTPEEIAKRLIQDNPGLQSPSALDQLQRWQQQLSEMSGILPKSTEMPPMPKWPPVRNPFPGRFPFPPMPESLRPPGPPPTPVPGDPQFPDRPIDPGAGYPDVPEEIFGPSPEELRRQRQYQAIKQFWERNFGSLNESPAFRQLLLELFTGNDPINLAVGDGLSMLLGDTDADPNAATDWMTSQLQASGLDFSQLELPELALPSWNADLPPAPSLSGPRSWTSLAEFLSQSGWVILIFGCALMGFIVWHQRKERTARTHAITALRYPTNWPVDPRNLSNHLEFIRAFEYLSLSLLGSVARSWHHRQIAQAIIAQVREPVPDTAMVEDLVRVYVLARYAPERESLDSHQLRTAGSALCRLAGIPGT
ncbi:MAG: hypothetical protein LC104_05590 [Bacteroidales bacterium]|nr:hypothetical protein [Bacteroidales bacterium]